MEDKLRPDLPAEALAKAGTGNAFGGAYFSKLTLAIPQKLLLDMIEGTGQTGLQLSTGLAF